jgi:sterol desaturase/sphingolipid hydroxylase (fatty acid hydroxylase superfamily)
MISQLRLRGKAQMNATFFVLFIGIFVFATVMGGTLGWMARSEKYSVLRIHKGRNPIADKLKGPTIAMNYSLPWIMYGGFFYFLGNYTIHAGLPSWPRLVFESLGSVLLYDFLYYFMHRAMHTKTGMRIIHGVHHKVRYVTAESGSYLHPLETFAGTALFLGSVVAIGPVSAAGFLIANFLFTTINIWVHSNFVFKAKWAGLLNFWSRTHDVHHYYCRNNYSSIFPFWDQMFGTHEAMVKVK